MPFATRPSSACEAHLPTSSRKRGRCLVAGAALIALAALPSCIPVLIGGAATGGYVGGQERGVGGAVTDTKIRAEINDLWFKYNSDMLQQLSLSVYEGRVLITGSVSNPQWKVEAVRLAWQADGVKQVDSEIQFADKSGIMDAARDELITTRLRSAILFDGKVRSVNYTIDVVNGVVYLSGSARTQGELDVVTNYARNIANVKRVVSYVRIRPGEPGAAPDVASSSPGGSQGGGSQGAPPPASSAAAPAEESAPAQPPPAAGPPAKIEVQPLQ